MKLTGILPVVATDPGVAASRAALPGGGNLTLTANVGVRPALLAQWAIDQAESQGDTAKSSPIVAVTATGRDAEELAHAVRCFLPSKLADGVAVLPSWETLPHEKLSPRADTVAQRISVFRRLAHPQNDGGPAGPIRVLVMPVRAALQPVVAGLGELEPVALQAGDRADLTDVAERLSAAAYSRVDMVERRGEFAVRGGILDVFPPTDDHPVRLEFWGDEVSEARWFAVADQRSLEIAEQGLWAPPCREILLTDEVRQRAAELVAQIPAAQEMLTKLASGIAVEGMESLAPVLVPQMQSVVEILPDAALVVINDPERVRRRAHDLVATTQEFLAAAWTSAAAGGSAPLDLSAASFDTVEQFREDAQARGFSWWELTHFSADALPQADHQESEPTVAVSVSAHPVESYRGDFARALADLRAWQHDAWRVVVVTQGPGPAQRMVEQLRAAGTPARLVAQLTEEPESGLVTVTAAMALEGMILPELRLAVLTEADLTGRAGVSTKDMRRMPSRRRNVVDPLQLKSGDFVVHEQHGVGRFIEMVQRTLGTGGNVATREYLVIEYASSKRGHPGDRLFVPMDQLSHVTKYTGGESPTLSKMGGGDWAKTKSKARQHVREIASELIRLYSARMATQGHAYGEDTPWQRELEDAFAYIETPDQLATIDEVKADMEKPIPMDRLICGDVGYGKTEIAVRAAFKAVQDGKQVAVLVPTTLLAEQHLETFSERYAGFPIAVRALSRFQGTKESADTIAGLAEGRIDVVIGTHRLITGEIRFKDLGLVIVDEEQRFGVEHKETLKQLRTNVDVLAMSATPIPRTLEMAVTGIREMSTLATPPEERHPVLTYVGAYDTHQIAAAIRRELLREGQVFYVHNRVESIERAGATLRELVPEARIGVAHGKMGESQLDQVIRAFWHKEIDVLVCTTIIETGLDISNANTLILERADLLGLSQLHQLRGRVGRGRERAYAYFLYPPERPLTETAHDRLATIAAHTELGAGMQVAMKDLEIRGAGNLLGGEQSGHIAGVGFDLYVRMVGEAVAAYRGDAAESEPDVTIELPVDAHLPETYIATERLRLEAYKKIAEAKTESHLSEVQAELEDRYGALPSSAVALCDVARLRLHAQRVGLADVTAQGKHIRFAPVELPDSAQLRLKRLYPGTILKPAIRAFLVPYPMTARWGGEALRGGALLGWAHQLIAAVIEGDIAAAARIQASR